MKIRARIIGIAIMPGRVSISHDQMTARIRDGNCTLATMIGCDNLVAHGVHARTRGCNWISETVEAKKHAL